MRHFCILSFASVLAFSAQASLAQEVKQRAEILADISVLLPAGWELVDFTEVASRISDDPVVPEHSVRFEATARSKVNLFQPYGKTVGPFEVLINTVPEGTARTLYGTASYVYTSGEWTGAPTIENPLDALGNPIDDFPNASLIIGTEFYKATIEKIREDELEKAKASMAKQLAALERVQSEQLAALEAEHAEASRVAQADHMDELAELRSTQAAELDQARIEGARLLGEARAMAEAELENIKTGFTMRYEQLKATHTETEEALKLQEEIIANREKVLDNDAWITQLDAQLTSLRKQTTRAFKGNWTGVGTCSDGDPRQFSFSLELGEQNGDTVSGGLTVFAESDGAFYDIGTVFPSFLTIASAPGSERTELVLTTQGDRRRDKLAGVFTLRSDGVLEGVTGKNNACQVLISR